MRTVQKELSRAMQEKDWDKAAAKLAEEEKLLPEDERGGLDFTRFSILIGKKDYAAADKLAAAMKETYKNDPRLQDELDMRRINILILTKEYPAMYKLVAQISETHKDNAMLQNMLAWRIATEKGIEQRDLALAETIATRANEAADGKDAQVLDTLARVLFMQGKKQQAIEFEEKAVSLATDRNKQELQNTLDSYRKDVLPKAD